MSGIDDTCVLRARGLCKRYGREGGLVRAVDGVNLDVAAGENGLPDFPVPWADRPEYSHLTTSYRLHAAIGASDFEIEQWNDLTGQAAAMMQTLLTLPPSPIGLQAFVPGFQAKASNLTAALADGRLRAIQGVARAI